MFKSHSLCKKLERSNSRTAFAVLLLARVTKGRVSLGRIAHEAVFPVVLHAVSDHVLHLGTITERVRENHGTDDGVVRHGSSSTDSRIDGAIRAAASARHRFHRGDSR